MVVKAEMQSRASGPQRRESKTAGSSTRRILPLILKQWRMLSGILLLTVSAAAVAAIQPLPMKLLVDYGLGSDPIPAGLRAFLSALSIESSQWSMVVLAGLAGIGIYAINAALEAGLVTAWSSAGQRMVYALGGAVFARLQRLSMRFHSKRSVGDSLSRVSDDAWCVYTLANGLLISPISQILKLGAVGFVAWRLDPQLAMLAFAAAPVLAGSTLFRPPPQESLEAGPRSSVAHHELRPSDHHFNSGRPDLRRRRPK